MRRLLTASIFILGTMPANAVDAKKSTVGEWETYRGFLVQPACGLAKNMDSCVDALNKWRRDFMWATDATWNNQYVGQRNIAVCLNDGCDDQVKKNPVLACAWATAVLNLNHPQLGNEDLERRQAYCASVTDDVDKEAAKGEAAHLIKMLQP